MKIQNRLLKTITLALTAATFTFCAWASADPPSRVARLGYMSNGVSFSPAGENEWVRASINRPLTTGDRLWTDTSARAEIQLGGATVRLGANTGVNLLNLDDRIAQIQLTQGTLNVRVRRLDSAQVFEVDTPNLAFTLTRAGEYRIMVDPDGNATTVIVRKGQGEAYGDGAAYVVDARQAYRFAGSGLREYQYVGTPAMDAFDRWGSDRDRRFDASASARYVSQDVVGYEDLDANGTWRNDATYGNVWYPSRVAADWAPYRDGHWAWIDPWGWTWMDDAPWGYAVSHYGRWANLRGNWGWVPGPVRTRAYYAPALVAFVGGDNFQVAISSGNVGGVAWFPLGPREVYRPSYTASRAYFERVNNSNTTINTTIINNTYNNVNVTNIVYANRQVPGAVIAIPTTAFVQAQPVSKSAVRISRDTNLAGPVTFVPRVAPTENSVRGNNADGVKPPARVFERPVVARTAPPRASAGFAAQQSQLAAKPGVPLNDDARKQLKPVASVPAPVINVVDQARAAPPSVRPPPVAKGNTAANGRENPDVRRNAPGTPAAPAAPASPAMPARPAPPAAAAPQAEQRGKTEQNGQSEQRVRPTAPVNVPPAQRATPVPPPQAAPTPSTAQQAERVRGEQRGRNEQRVQPGAPAPAATPNDAPPQAAAPRPPRAAPPPPAEPRGRSEQRGNAESRPQPAEPARRAVPPAATPAAPAQEAPPPRRAEPREPAAAPSSRPQPVPQAPRSAPREQAPRPEADKPEDKPKDREEQKRDREDRKTKD
ncbi:MAG: DUF6600 domain-containing protein [Usitatibacteraceae bacterium]